MKQTRKAEITILRAIVRTYYSNRPVLSPEALARRLWKHDRPLDSEVTNRTLIEKNEAMCLSEWGRSL